MTHDVFVRGTRSECPSEDWHPMKGYGPPCLLWGDEDCSHGRSLCLRDGTHVTFPKAYDDLLVHVATPGRFIRGEAPAVDNPFDV